MCCYIIHPLIHMSYVVTIRNVCMCVRKKHSRIRKYHKRQQYTIYFNFSSFNTENKYKWLFMLPNTCYCTFFVCVYNNKDNKIRTSIRRIFSFFHAKKKIIIYIRQITCIRDLSYQRHLPSFCCFYEVKLNANVIQNHVNNKSQFTCGKDCISPLKCFVGFCY